MLVHVTRSAFPPSLGNFWEQIESDGATNFELLLERRGFDGWSLPASTMSGHPVWFQLTATSVSSARSVIRQADDVGDSEAADHIRTLLPEIERWAGSLVAVGLVDGGPYRSTPVDGHFKGRIFAPVGRLTPLSNPVSTTSGSKLSDLGPFARTASQLTNRLVGGDQEYRRMLRIVEQEGNTIPAWARVKLNARTGNWQSTANDVTCSWLSELQLADQFAIPMCRDLADRRRVLREVGVQPDSEKRRVGWAVDALITLDGVPIPVEFKLNREAEADLPRQLRQYSGPASARKLEGSRRQEWRIEHPYVIVIDHVGADVYASGVRIVGMPDLSIERGDFTPARVRAFRDALSTLCNT